MLKRILNLGSKDLYLFKKKKNKKNGPLGYSVDDLLDLFFIKELKKKYPHEISAGQAQRVSLVRSIIHNPDLLLLDEPLANIDQYLKNKIQDNLKQVLKKSGLTTIIVTHDKFEAFYLGDYWWCTT